MATGLAANVQDGNLKDVGRVIWLPGTNEIVFSGGPHPVREAIEFGNFQTALGAFCDVLKPTSHDRASRAVRIDALEPCDDRGAAPMPSPSRSTPP